MEAEPKLHRKTKIAPLVCVQCRETYVPAKRTGNTAECSLDHVLNLYIGVVAPVSAGQHTYVFRCAPNQVDLVGYAKKCGRKFGTQVAEICGVRSVVRNHDPSSSPT